MARYFSRQYRSATERRGYTGQYPEWFITSNPDIDFEANDLFELLGRSYATGKPSVLAPALRSARGVNANPYLERRPPKLRMHAYKWLFRYALSARIYGHLGLGGRVVYR
jgi:hypothetical protein